MTRPAAANTLDQAKAALNHLDTRESELKVSAYRAVIESDVQAILDELAEDAVTVDEAVAAVDELDLPADVRADFDAVKPDIDDFTVFVAAVRSRRRPTDQSAVREREPEVAERNHASTTSWKPSTRRSTRRSSRRTPRGRRREQRALL